MSTNATILKEDVNNGTYYGVYVHWEGDSLLDDLAGLVKLNFDGSYEKMLNKIFEHAAWSSIRKDPSSNVGQMAGAHISHEPLIGNYYNDIDDTADMQKFASLEDIESLGEEYNYIFDNWFTKVTVLSPNGRKVVKL